MRQKIFVLVVTPVMIISSIVINSSDLEVEATPGGRGGEDDGIELDYDYIWEQTVNFSNVIYKYPDGMIPKGRSFGSWGGNYTVNTTLIPEMNYTIGLEEVHTEQIKHIPGINKNYTSIINVSDFRLTVNNDNYSLPNPIPIKEIFVIPAGRNQTSFCGSCTFNQTFENVEIVPNNMTNIDDSFFDNYLNISSYEDLNAYGPVIFGKLEYINESEEIPDTDNQTDRVFLFDDVPSVQDKLDNLTDAMGSIIADSDDIGGRNYVNETRCNSYPVVSISNSDGNTVKGILENNSYVLVENFTGNLIITYDFCNSSKLPSSDYIFIDRIPDHHELADGINYPTELLNKIIELFGLDPIEYSFKHYLACWGLKTLWWWEVNLARQICGKSQCKGFILYDSFETHFMLTPFVRWYPARWDAGSTIERALWKNPAIPTFTLNYTVGSFLVNNYSDTTLTGHCNQTFLEETNNSVGVEAYNVIGNITIPHSPNDAIAVISNRYDGWWGQTPCDSGVGGAIVLGIAKYMKDYNIKPKYNLTFLFTTGEEYNFRGAWHYNDSHKEPEYNMKYWLGLDQLAFDQNDTVMALYCKNKDHKQILEFISNQTGYTARTDYVIKHHVGDSGGSEQFVYSTRTNCSTFMIVKGDEDRWDRWHRTGMNYTEGDSLKYTDRDDVNVTAELAWNITKYFMVNPDCWFENVNFTAFDSSDDDDLNDSVSVTFSINTILPHDLVMVNASLYYNETGEVVANKKVNYTVTSDGINVTITLTVPEDEKEGLYTCILYLYNSTGRINEIIELDVQGNKYNDSIWNLSYLHPNKEGKKTIGFQHKKTDKRNKLRIDKNQLEKIRRICPSCLSFGELRKLARLIPIVYYGFDSYVVPGCSALYVIDSPSRKVEGVVSACKVLDFVDRYNEYPREIYKLIDRNNIDEAFVKCIVGYDLEYETESRGSIDN